jgi:class 3 adenylate cyclase
VGDLPSGTVTFLFTDIEGSSAQWEADPPAMRARLARHDELLRQAIESRHGLVFKHLGDGMCAAFASAPDALAAAAAAQAALRVERWPGGEGPRVRMGLHTGEASPTAGDYFGPAVNRAARVMSAAKGGQVVTSAATAALCPHADLRDAGRHLLAGVGAERLFVLVSDTGDTRALRSRTVTPTNLVADVSSFVGRADDVKELADLVATHPLVTLVGPGGVGKTRLAAETAVQLAERFVDGIWRCELAPVGDPDRVATAVAETFGARPQAGADLADAIALHLEGRAPRCSARLA